MPRKKRELEDGGIYHIFNRGNDRMALFQEPSDRGFFLSQFLKNKIIYNIKIHHYCLMQNHFHFLLSVTKGEDLPKFMHACQLAYARYFKKKYDFVIVDSSPSLDEETLAVMLASDEIFVVSTPDHPTMSTSLKAAKLAKQRGNPISGIILNKVHKKDFELSMDEVENTLDIPVLAVIPYDINVLRALAKMEPSTTYKPGSEGSSEFMKFAALLSGQEYKKVSWRDFIRGFVPTRSDINREIFYQRVFK